MAKDLTQALYVAALALGRTRDAEEVVRVAVTETQRAAGVESADAHRTRLMQKLDIHDVAGLTRYAIRHGIIQP